VHFLPASQTASSANGIVQVRKGWNREERRKGFPVVTDPNGHGPQGAFR